MRSKRLLPALVLTLACPAVPAFAGGLGLYGSYWDTDKLGETTGGGVKYAFGDAGLRLELRGSYYPDLAEDLDLFGLRGPFDVEALVPEAGIAFHFAPGSPLQPYVGAGLSYYLFDSTFPIAGVELDDEVGVYAVGGFEGGGGRTGFFAEAVYRSIEGTVTEQDEIVDEVDLDLSGISFNLGIVFRF